MTRHSYKLVDVFTDRAFGGNQLAVFTDAAGIAPELMQPIANELAIAETTFVLPPTASGADHRVRIFTPAKELPFAGHPTVGTAFVLSDGRARDLRLEEGVGVIAVRCRDGFVQMDQPVPTFGDVARDPAAVLDALSLDADDLVASSPLQTVSSGIPFRFVHVRGLAAVARVRPKAGIVRDNLYVFTTETVEKGSAVHARMLGNGVGVAEDPATGSAQGPLGAYLVRYDILRAPSGGTLRFRTEQGFEIGRRSLLDVEIDVSGASVVAARAGGGCVAMGGGWFDL